MANGTAIDKLNLQIAELVSRFNPEEIRDILMGTEQSLLADTQQQQQQQQQQARRPAPDTVIKG
jgi:hypothetical protein